MTWLAERFELSRGAGDNLRPMEGLRGFAVVLVFFVHYTTLISPWVPARSWLSSVIAFLHESGSAGVDLFFILSGYLIYGSLISKATQFRVFFRRRLQRLYPTFLAVLIFYLVLSVLIPEENKIPSGVWPAAGYLLANLLFLPGIFPMKPMITVTWSLSYEMFFYLAIPLLIGLAALKSRPANVRILLFLAGIFCLVMWCAVFGGPVRLVGFLMGMVLFELLRDKTWSVPSSAVAISVAAAGLAIMPISATAAWVYPVKILFLSSSLMTLVFACLGRPQSDSANWFSWTPLRWLGNMSYSYYLVHGVTLLGLFRLFSRIWPTTRQSELLSMALAPLTFAMTLLSSGILFLAVERPFSLKPAPHAKLLEPAIRPASLGGEISN